MSIEGQGHLFTIYFPGFVCFVFYKAKISGERLQDHWSSGLYGHVDAYLLQLSHTLIIHYTTLLETTLQQKDCSLKLALIHILC